MIINFLINYNRFYLIIQFDFLILKILFVFFYLQFLNHKLYHLIFYFQYLNHHIIIKYFIFFLYFNLLNHL